jgi:hypothetical protein
MTRTRYMVDRGGFSLRLRMPELMDIGDTKRHSD